MAGKALAAACTAPSTDYGTATASVTIPATATYRVWTRLKVPDATNNNYLLELDGNKCYTVGGGSIAANTWTWVAYQNGSASSKIDVSLSQGNHTYKLIGNKPGVLVDRLVFTSDLNCVPTTASGSECNAPADTASPTVHLTAPTAGATVKGTVNITATATDDIGVTRVEFYINGSLLGTDTTAPYSMSWDTTKAQNSAQLVSVRAYDAANKVGTDDITVTPSNGDIVAPSVPTGLAAQATSFNTVTVTWKASTDNSLVTGYTISRDGVPLANLGNVTTYSDTGLNAGTTYSYKVLAFDAAGNKSANSSAVSVTTPKPASDTQAPTAPANLEAQVNSSSQITLDWQASTDNIGVVGYNVYRGQGSTRPTLVATSPTTSFGDTNLSAGTSYTYYVVAKDGSGNMSTPSASVTITTEKPVEPGQDFVIRGLITNQANGRRIRYASVMIVDGNTRHIYQANRSGAYAIQGLKAGRYNLTFRAFGYFSKTVAVTVDGDQAIIEKDISLQKR